MANQSLSLQTIIGMVVVAILWAICFPFITVGLPDAPPLLFASIRALLAGEGFEVDWTWSFAGAVFVLAIPATALMVVLWYALLARAPLNKLNPFTFLTPIFGLLIGTLFFDETFSTVEMTGIAITVAGLLVIIIVPKQESVLLES